MLEDQSLFAFAETVDSADPAANIEGMRKDQRTEQTIVGKEVTRLRRQKGWTLKELAARAHVTPATLRGCERGTKHTQSDKLARIAKQLGTTSDRLKHVEPKDPRTRDLQDEDYLVAQWFHHAPRVIKNTVWELREGKHIGGALTDPEFMTLLQGWATLTEKQKSYVLMNYRFVLTNPDADRSHHSESDAGGAPDGFPAVHPKVRSPQR